MSMTSKEFYDTYNATNGMPALTQMGESSKPSPGSDFKFVPLPPPAPEPVSHYSPDPDEPPQISISNHAQKAVGQARQNQQRRKQIREVDCSPRIVQLSEWCGGLVKDVPSLNEQVDLIVRDVEETARLLEQGARDVASGDCDRLFTPLGLLAQCGLGLFAVLPAEACGLSIEAVACIGAGGFLLPLAVLLLSPLLLYVTAGCNVLGRLLLIIGGVSLCVSVPYALYLWFTSIS